MPGHIHCDYGIVKYAINRPPDKRLCISYLSFFQQAQVIFSHYSRLISGNDEVFIIQTIKRVKYEHKKWPHKMWKQTCNHNQSHRAETGMAYINANQVHTEGEFHSCFCGNSVHKTEGKVCFTGCMQHKSIMWRFLDTRILYQYMRNMTAILE